MVWPGNHFDDTPRYTGAREHHDPIHEASENAPQVLRAQETCQTQTGKTDPQEPEQNLNRGRVTYVTCRWM